MSFTYDFATNAVISRIRLAIGDVTLGTGIRPDGTNFTDEEITAILTQAGGDIGSATYIFLKSLANMWGVYTDITVGPRKESLSQIAKYYASRSIEVGIATGLSAKSFSTMLTRVDGYSEGM